MEDINEEYPNLAAYELDVEENYCDFMQAFLDFNI